jgi:hypothetical protein
MAEARTAIADKPAWVDLTSSDAAASREFYGKLFGWDIEVNADPQYGGYGMARIDGQDVAGISPKMDPNSPTAWSIYIGTDDPEELTEKVRAAGGTVVMEPFAVGEMGKMAVYQAPDGAFISAWQPAGMSTFNTGSANTFGWAELSSRDIDKAVAFYGKVFGWTPHQMETGEGGPPYTELQLDGKSIAGAMPMNPMVPAEMPSYWLVYFGVEDVDKSHQKAIDAGASEMMAPQDFPGGRFSILGDPQGAAFGLLKMQPRA